MGKTIDKIAGLFNWVAIVALLLMFAVVAIDILSSKILNKPVTATVDIMSLLATTVASFSLSRTILAGRHIEVEFITSRVPLIMARVAFVFSRLLSMCFFILVVWRTFVYAHNLYILKEATLTQHIPVAPFAYAMGVAFIPAIIIYALEIYRGIKGEGR